MNYAIRKSLFVLGENIRTMRAIKRLPQSVVAERAGIALSTLSAIENGSLSAEIGNVAAVLAASGFGYPFRVFLAPANDSTGMFLEEERLPQRIRNG